MKVNRKSFYTAKQKDSGTEGGVKMWSDCVRLGEVDCL
jgi:hypothetical protein